MNIILSCIWGLEMTVFGMGLENAKFLIAGSRKYYIFINFVVGNVSKMQKHGVGGPGPDDACFPPQHIKTV